MHSNEQSQRLRTQLDRVTTRVSAQRQWQLLCSVTAPSRADETSPAEVTAG